VNKKIIVGKNENLPQEKMNLSPSVTGCENKCTGAYTECSTTYWPNFRSYGYGFY
jgi:hypothetical protein